VRPSGAASGAARNWNVAPMINGSFWVLASMWARTTPASEHSSVSASAA